MSQRSNDNYDRLSHGLKEPARPTSSSSSVQDQFKSNHQNRTRSGKKVVMPSAELFRSSKTISYNSEPLHVKGNAISRTVSELGELAKQLSPEFNLNSRQIMNLLDLHDSDENQSVRDAPRAQLDDG